jgi:cob(I)alamin adenosyltransferase
MSIATRTGDNGTTGLMYGKRVSKNHDRVNAYGTIDELNAALGLARSMADQPWIVDHLLKTQKDLVALMGELACSHEDAEKYLKSDYPWIKNEHLERLDQIVKDIEAQNITFEGWATPGATQHAAALDLARTICRRAERDVIHLGESESPVRSIILQYLNRLSDALWLMARLDETRHGLRESIPIKT